jgi:hypothetical protein
MYLIAGHLSWRIAVQVFCLYVIASTLVAEILRYVVHD